MDENDRYYLDVKEAFELAHQARNSEDFPILGYAKPQNAIAKRCKGALKRGTPTPSGIQEMLFIPEADLYRLAFGSKLPTAEQFTDWVVEEVLPSIHENGSYSLPEHRFKALCLLAAGGLYAVLFLGVTALCGVLGAAVTGILTVIISIAVGDAL